VKYHLLGESALAGCRLAARHAGRHRPPRDRRADEHGAEEREEVRADVVEEDRLLGSLRRRAALEDGRLHAAVLVESAMRFLLMILVALALGAEAKTVRSAGAKARFAREHPCPATGRRLTSCPGYVIDHIEPLCAGGEDAPANMQWQTVADAKVKDRWEREFCRRLHSGLPTGGEPNVVRTAP
jgi:hypothetical protein